MKKGKFETILLVVDGSDMAIRAGKYAVMLAKANDAKLIALYVVDTASIKELLLSQIFIDEESREYESNLEENGKKYLHIVDELANEKKCKMETILERGGIYARIVETAMERKADLIVIGSRSRKVQKSDTRDLLSSEYTKVLREANIPVLFVKGEDVDRDFKKF